jgi:putative FmdB family regulatory protein
MSGGAPSWVVATQPSLMRLINPIKTRRMHKAMPTYVYACEACGKQFEQFQSFKDDPLSVCRCGVEGKVRRVIQPAGVVFKGSGWYINDSRGATSSTVSADSAKAEKAEGGEKPATSEKAEKPEKAEGGEKPATSEKSSKSESPASSSPA